MPNSKENSPASVQSGEELRALREEKGLTKRAFAQSLGVSDVQIGRLERGVARLTESFLNKVKEVYGRELSSLDAAPEKAQDADKKKAIKEKGKEETEELKETAKSKDIKETITQKKEPEIYIQSLMGGTISVEEILAKLCDAEADIVYVKPEENRAYWVGKNSSGAVYLW